MEKHLQYVLDNAAAACGEEIDPSKVVMVGDSLGSDGGAAADLQELFIKPQTGAVCSDGEGNRHG